MAKQQPDKRTLHARREVIRHGAWVIFYVVALILSSNLIFGEVQRWWAYLIWVILLLGVALAGANSIWELASSIRYLRSMKPQKQVVSEQESPDSPEHD